MIKKKIFISISILCIILAAFFKFFITKNIFILNNNLFVDKETSYNNIINSRYFNTLNKINLQARGCNNLEDCKKIYKENLTEFTIEEKDTLRNLITHANDITNNLKKFNKIPWKFSKTSSKIENGFPFTIGKIIYISDAFLKKSEKYKLETIIHEKIHVFQRKYKRKTQKLYEDLEFKKIKLIIDPLRRHNPDLDGFDYKYNGVIIYNKFNNHEPTGLIDSNTVYLPYNKNIVNKMISNSYNNEHPNEIFAYIISKKIIKNNLNNKFKKYLT